MQKALIIKGRVTGPHQVELAEAAPLVGADVEVIIHSVQPNGEPRQSLSEIIEQMGPGTRSKEEIDRQLDKERESWDRPL